MFLNIQRLKNGDILYLGKYHNFILCYSGGNLWKSFLKKELQWF